MNDVARLTERIRKLRIDQGLGPYPKPIPKLVSTPLALDIIDRLKPFTAIVVKYARILASGEVTRIDTDRLSQYVEYAKLLKHAEGELYGVPGFGVKLSLGVINRVNNAIDEDKLDTLDINAQVRSLHIALKWLTSRDTMKKAEVFSDEETFQAAIADVKKRIEEETE
ncbi:hypothetical protein MF628_003634 [Paenibacillus polymyxa]|uniref:hypothetical protein n=1 Tax=Paenibacillus polymyxa TaxID=1406 RepID=UPI0020240512|nr:hypothetical protein [Paenibacillus polymyxa]URJ43970.1 hypothetical protein MF628_003634 [Paenibacillus polymyxa]